MSTALGTATDGLVRLSTINSEIEAAGDDDTKRMHKVGFRVFQIIVARQICEYNAESHGVRLANVYNILCKEMSS